LLSLCAPWVAFVSGRESNDYLPAGF